MKLVANVKLLPTPEQYALLKQTLERANEACNFVSERAWETKTFKQFALHKLTYAAVRDQFGLSAQVAVRCIAKVADAYKLDTKVRRAFRKHSAQPYDDRIFRFLNDSVVSIWTLGGRIKVDCVTGEHQRKLLVHRKGEVDLMFVRGEFYVACVCDVDDPDLIETTDVLGVDFGIVNLAVDSNGNEYSGKEVEAKRRIYANRRRNLQRKGTRAAKRKLRTLKGRQARYQKDVNHTISKRLVAEAKRSNSDIALEDLKGIRERVKAKKTQRARLSNWSFSQLRQFVIYKARMAGIAVISVDPRNTSRTCAKCGHCEKANRTERDMFRCRQCGHTAPADTNAALNIRAKAAVSRPNGSAHLGVAKVA
jgi:putative transposase